MLSTLMRSRLWFGCLAFLAMSCRSDQLVHPVIHDPAQVYWRLDINHPVAMLSVQRPYDTVQLIARALNVYGDPIAITEPPVFRNLVSIDTAITVDSTGFITARYPTGANSRIEIALRVGHYTKLDTVIVMVRDNPTIQSIDSIRLRPDSAWIWAGYTLSGSYTSWTRVYSGISEIPVNQVLLSYSVDDLDLADCNVNVGFAGSSCGAGETYVRVTMYVYGKTLSDSVLIRVIDPPVKVVVFRTLTRPDGSHEVGFFPPRLQIQQGYTVLFLNRAARTGLAASSGLIGLSWANVSNAVTVGSAVWTYTDSVDIMFERPEDVSPGIGYRILRHTTELIEICNTISLCLSSGFLPAADGMSGNIPAFGHVWKSSDPIFTETDMGIRSRQFNVPGEFHYTSSRFPTATGTIIVTE